MDHRSCAYSAESCSHHMQADTWVHMELERRMQTSTASSVVLLELCFARSPRHQAGCMRRTLLSSAHVAAPTRLSAPEGQPTLSSAASCGAAVQHPAPSAPTPPPHLHTDTVSQLQACKII